MKDRKNIFFTSDWHIGHESVIKFDDRPFKDVDQMAKVLINNYNACVTEDSVCYFLGDMGLCNSKVLAGVIRQLNGTKVLILGNHDRNTYSMYKQGFDVVLNSAVLYIGQNRISMSHCPLPGIVREDVSRGLKPGEHWHGERKNQMFTSQDLTVAYHLHGHVHKSAKESDRFTERQFDVGVRANGYRPVSISQIEAWIGKLQKANK